MKTKLFLIIGISFFVTITVVSIIFTFFSVMNQRMVPVGLEVSDRVGFNLTNDGNFHLGSTLRGGGMQRDIEIVFTKDSKVNIKVKGEIASMITLSENNFFLPKNTAKNVTVYADVPLNATMGKHEGTIVISFVRPWFR